MTTDFSINWAPFAPPAIDMMRAKKLMEVVDEHFLVLPQPETDDDIRHIEMLGMYRGLLMSVM